MRAISIVLLGITGIISPIAFAQNTLTENELQSIFAEIAHLKKVQAETQNRIIRLESLLNVGTSEPDKIDGPSLFSTSEIIAPNISNTPKLDVSGDFLLRYEGNYNSPTSSDRERAVMRARMRASYQASDTVRLGAMLETGDPDDPNSGYVTIDEFADDLQLSLSQAYLEYNKNGLIVRGGKIPNPFTKTDLVWDGDVYPTGLSLQSDLISTDRHKLSISSLLFLIDESPVRDDSFMLGGQLSYRTSIGSQIELNLNGAFYDYEIGSMDGARLGDIRDNMIDKDGKYLSDFDILDLLASFKWSGTNAKWPITLDANFVKNQSAAIDEDTAYGLDLNIGSNSTQGDMKFGYGYGQAEIDAVFAAFSNDNFRFATNYETHKLSAAYQLNDIMQLSASLHHYRRLNELYINDGADNDWQDRIRFNFIIKY